MSSTSNNEIKAIAIHLPQFHPIPENDAWWGKGFTEWTNVTKAKPLFDGHYQPHLPTDLGFYDLRLEEARVAQAELAEAYGIYGFCYYHYWFNSRRLLNRPLDDMLKTKTPNFPFMLCWANENWTRKWDGLENEILMKQEYSAEDDKNHINFLCKHFFSDDRYIRKDGKPFFLIYKPALFPDIEKTITTWREEARKCGTGELYLGYMKSFSSENNPLYAGFDCAVDFQPNFSLPPGLTIKTLIEKVKRRLGVPLRIYGRNHLFSYRKYVDLMIKIRSKKNGLIPGITPGWDNSARRNPGAFIFRDANPDDYSRWLAAIKNSVDRDSFLFINAWNEWAEGNHLEPCIKWGRKYLEATRKILKNE
jgi:lipopolysaccharide biosynthesis protein